MPLVGFHTEDLVGFTEAARRIGISRQRLHKWADGGKCYRVVVGRYSYLWCDEVERLAAKRKAGKDGSEG